MDNLIEELLGLIAGVDKEEDLLVKIAETAWSGTSLQLRVKVSVIDCSELGTWVIRCGHALAYMLGSGRAYSLDLTDDHPLLWEFRHPSASAYFFGAPVNSEACVGALYAAHSNAVGSWISFGSQLNGAPRVSELLSTGNGLLAQGPVPLLSLYKRALLPHGVEVSIVNEHPPRFWDKTMRRSFEGEAVKALLLGTSYVVGIDWTAERDDR